MSRKLLVIFGATGAQGGSVARTVLSDPELSKQFRIRAVTRDASKPSSQALASGGAEVVEADLDDAASVNAACAGAHTVFGVTFSDDDKPIENEFVQGKTVADGAVAARASWLVFSTLPKTREISGGKYARVVHFDVKARVEEYVRSLPIRSAFFSPGTFMSNFTSHMKPRPSWTGDGSYILSGPQSAETKFPLIDTEGDTGKWIAAILADPEKYEGKILYGATKLVTQTELAETFSKVTGKTVKYVQVDAETFAGYIPHRGWEVVDMVLYFQDFGYWGADTEEGVKWSSEQARGKLTTVEEYLTKLNPMTLD